MQPTDLADLAFSKTAWLFQGGEQADHSIFVTRTPPGAGVPPPAGAAYAATWPARPEPAPEDTARGPRHRCTRGDRARP